MRKVLGLLLLLSVVSAAWAQERQDTIVVSRDGTGNFCTLQEGYRECAGFHGLYCYDLCEERSIQGESDCSFMGGKYRYYR